MTVEKEGAGSSANASPVPEAETASPSSPSTSDNEKSPKPQSSWDKVLSVAQWMPPWCRFDREHPPVFSTPMNVLFGFSAGFTVANLYYNHPILNILAVDFGVSYEKVSEIPTLMQAGYACGLLFLCPLGDLFKRRPFVLSLVFFTATMWIGLCTTHSFSAFSAISFITAITTVTPQLMLPLVGDLAPPHRRATALSIVVSGNIMGILVARILSGVVTNYTSWRNIYWLALGLQYTIFILLWLFMPDYPSTNPGGMNYFKMLWSILGMLRKHPILVQASLISMLTSATFTSYWTTLTFLLAGAPYHYSSVVIGLFGLIGLAGMLLGPLFARKFIDRFVPIVSVILGEFLNLVGIVVGTYTGLITVAGPVIQALALDAGLILTQIANRSSIYAVEPTGRNRVNTAFMVCTFFGQIMGTSAGNHLYDNYGGWVASGSLSVAFVALAMIVCVLRGPWEEGWIGWTGGWSIRKKNKNSADGKTTEAASAVRQTDEEAGGAPGGAEMTAVDKALGEMAGEDGENPVRVMNDEREKEATRKTESLPIEESVSIR